MTRTVEEILLEAGDVAAKLMTTLSSEFNKISFKIDAGVAKNEDGKPDFYFVLSDRNDPHTFLPEEVADYAKKKLKEIVPDAKPVVKRMRIPRNTCPERL